MRKWIIVFIAISICLVLNACTSSGNTSDSTVGSVQAEIEEVAPAAGLETDEEEVSWSFSTVPIPGLIPDLDISPIRMRRRCPNFSVMEML